MRLGNGGLVILEVKMKDNTLIFRCGCGHPGYIEFYKDEDDKNTMWVSLIDEPSGFFNWLKMWLHRKVYYSELFLNKKQVEKFVKFLNDRSTKPNQPRR